MRQFPTPLLTLVARFVTFIVGSSRRADGPLGSMLPSSCALRMAGVGSLAAVLIGLSLVNESVLVFYRTSSCE